MKLDLNALIVESFDTKLSNATLMVVDAPTPPYRTCSCVPPI